MIRSDEMAKKRDILSNYFNEFPKYKSEYQSRLDQLKRDFNNEKTVYNKLLKDIEKEYLEDQNLHLNQYIKEEKHHQHRKSLVGNDYQERFEFLTEEIENNYQDISEKIEEENKLYQEVLDQFEERKQEALDRYLQLIHESDHQIDDSVDVHYNFIDQENADAKLMKEHYQDINTFLSNDLLNTMEKAKNALDSLQETLQESNINDSKELNQTILKSIEHLRGTQFDIISLFKDNSNNLEKQRETIKQISKTKQQPHSELNQEMIQKYVKQIREINDEKIVFEAKVKTDLGLSLQNVYDKIIKAHDNKDYQSLRKYISQKEIIEKKAEYLLHRNNTLATFTVSKYQQEIKKIKIDSFKRSEEIKLAYSLPMAFLQNSIDTYSNFAFYLNQGFDELDRLLTTLIDFNQEHLDSKTEFLTKTSKAYEDYKINLMIRINEVSNNLAKLISRIDDVSLEIVTLESKNRLEIAEIRKKLENLEILGDYQKYLASLENDEFFAMYQHNKNIEKIQLDAKYKSNLLKINWDVLELNKNKELSGESLQYMLNLSQEEEKIHKLSFDKMLSEFEAFYNQQNKMSYIMYKMAKLNILDEIKSKNYFYVDRYMRIRNNKLQQDKSSSDHVIDFVHHMQNLIDTNNFTTSVYKEQLTSSEYGYAYLSIVEKNRKLLLDQIDQQTDRKIAASYQAATLYYQETKSLVDEIFALVDFHLKKIKELLIFNEQLTINYQSEIVQKKGFSSELSALMTYVYQTTVKYANKYQIEEEIQNLTINYNESLTNFNNLALAVFTKIKPQSRKNTIYKHIQTYLIKTLEIFNEYKHLTNNSLEKIREMITNNDLMFIANTKIAAEENKKIIEKEYDSLAFEAIRLKTKRKEQINALLTNSDQFNEMFKKRVKNINDEYLRQTQKTDEFLEFIEGEIVRIIKTNDKQLIKMLKLIDKEIFEERLRFNRQYQKFINTVNSLKANIAETYDSEVKYLYDLNFDRENDIKKTIELLESRVNSLPEEKTGILQTLDYQKNELFTLKQDELLKKFSEIEANKLQSKPNLVNQIEQIKKRLPKDYIKLYREVQELENEFLQQYTLINESYKETYQDYMNKQVANRIILDSDTKVFKAFDWLNTYHKDLLNIFQLNYKETVQKSIDTREAIKEEKQKSKDKQDRIINA